MEKLNENAVVKWLLMALVLMILAISGAILLNTHESQKAISTHTQQYLNDVAASITELIDNEITSNAVDLASLGDSLVRIDADKREEYLKRKMEYLKLVDVALVDGEGKATYLDKRVEDFGQNSAFEQAMNGQSSVWISEDHHYVYQMVPIFQGTDFTIINGALIGVKDIEQYQNLLTNESFKGQGASCIINQSGQVVVSNKNQTMFKAIEDLFDHAAENDLLSVEEQIIDDLAALRQNNITLQLSDGSKIALSYMPLKTNDWLVMTMIPYNVIYEEIGYFNQKSITLNFITIILFALILAAIMLILRKGQRDLETLAFRDQVTGGNSSIYFQQKAGQMIRESSAGQYVMVSADIKNFKFLNDVFGTKNGNKTLAYIYHVLESHCQHNELLGRGDADVFYLLLNNDEKEALKKRFAEMIADINRFNEHRVQPYYLHIAIGVYTIEDTAMDLFNIQDRANIARKSVSENYQDNCAFYDVTKHNKLLEEKELTNMMEIGLSNHEFQVYLQPKVRLDDWKIAGAEALVRWERPGKGLISPGSFIPAFERNGIICRVDLYVFDRVCNLLDRWQKEGKEMMTVSINLSRQHLKNPDFLKEYQQIFDQYNFPPQYIEMEITESIMFEDDELFKAADVVRAIHQMGFRCSIDDFGYGYSSLGILKIMEVDVLKLDRKFFDYEMQNKRGVYIIQSILELAKKLDMETVAEGIEAANQVEFLKHLDCSMIQGYVFSKPLSISDFEVFAYEQNVIRCVGESISLN